MKTTDEFLQRLLHRAAQATPPPAEPPLGMEGRVLAAWRSGGEREVFDPFTVLRPILIGAFALVCVVGALGYKSLTDDSSDPSAFVTNSAFQVALNR